MIRTKLKEYRAKYNMTQEDLAQRVGVRRETIGNLEKGRYNPSLVLAWRIAQVFPSPSRKSSSSKHKTAGRESRPAVLHATNCPRSPQTSPSHGLARQGKPSRSGRSPQKPEGPN